MAEAIFFRRVRGCGRQDLLQGVQGTRLIFFCGASIYIKSLFKNSWAPVSMVSIDKDLVGREEVLMHLFVVQSVHVKILCPLSDAGRVINE